MKNEEQLHAMHKWSTDVDDMARGWELDERVSGEGEAKYVSHRS
jgi:hypothetical protein